MSFSYSESFVEAVRDFLTPEKDHVFFNRFLASEISGERTDRITGSQLRVLNRITPLQNKEVLDFGCGTGQSLVGLVSTGARVTGIEPDEKRLAIAALRLREHGIGQSRVKMIHVPDTTRLPFYSHTFDVCFCNAVLEHIPGNRGPCLREMWRVLKPGGILSISETSWLASELIFAISLPALPEEAWVASSFNLSIIFDI